MRFLKMAYAQCFWERWSIPVTYLKWFAVSWQHLYSSGGLLKPLQLFSPFILHTREVFTVFTKYLMCSFKIVFIFFFYLNLALWSQKESITFKMNTRINFWLCLFSYLGRNWGRHWRTGETFWNIYFFSTVLYI